ARTGARCGGSASRPAAPPAAAPPSTPWDRTAPVRPRLRRRSRAPPPWRRLPRLPGRAGPCDPLDPKRCLSILSISCAIVEHHLPPNRNQEGSNDRTQEVLGAGWRRPRLAEGEAPLLVCQLLRSEPHGL